MDEGSIATDEEFSRYLNRLKLIFVDDYKLQVYIIYDINFNKTSKKKLLFRKSGFLEIMILEEKVLKESQQVNYKDSILILA